LFTIVTTGTDSVADNLCKQLGKLVKVRYVEQLTDVPRVERELVLVKISVPDTDARTDIMHLAEVFRARVLDFGDKALTLMVTGDAGKCLAFAQAASKYGDIVQLARTGKIALKRGEPVPRGSGGWGECQDQRKVSAAVSAAAAAASTPSVRSAVNAAGAGAVAAAAQQPQSIGVYDIYSGSVDGDDTYEMSKAQNILDAAYDDGASASSAHTLSILVQDVPGVLNQVTGVIGRRAFNVQSLAVGPCEEKGMSRITCVVPSSALGVNNLIKQLEKLVYVEKVEDLYESAFIARELMLVKVRCTSAQRGELHNIAEIFHANVVDMSLGTITIEVTGRETKMRALQDILLPYGILEVARTGRVAMSREGGVDSRVLQKKQAAKLMF